jgi:hypothetical protein
LRSRSQEALNRSRHWRPSLLDKKGPANRRRVIAGNPAAEAAEESGEPMGPSRLEWEYLREVAPISTVSPQLDPEWVRMSDLGALGWELTAAVHLDTSLYFYFKRPKPS